MSGRDVPAQTQLMPDRLTTQQVKWACGGKEVVEEGAANAP